MHKNTFQVRFEGLRQLVYRLLCSGIWFLVVCMDSP